MTDVGGGFGVGVGVGGGFGVGAGVGAGVGVGPYAELTFDSEGDVDRVTQGAVSRMEATDLLVFAHGWNSDRSTATRLYDRFFAPFQELVGSGVRLGYVGVVWPAMSFSDEPIPDFDAPGVLAEPGFAGALDPLTRRALGEFWPERRAELDRVAELLEEQPDSAAAFIEFGALVRELAGVDAVPAAVAPSVPAIFTNDVLEVCRALSVALVRAGAPGAAVPAGADGPGLTVGGGLRGLWGGAKELLRQAAYYKMKKRAGVVGERGLGPVLAQLAAARPALRFHLIGHSFGARVVSFSLRAVPDRARYVKSVTLLQGPSRTTRSPTGCRTTRATAAHCAGSSAGSTGRWSPAIPRTTRPSRSSTHWPPGWRAIRPDFWVSTSGGAPSGTTGSRRSRVRPG